MTIKFLLQSKKNPANIYVRISISRGNTPKRPTGYVIDPKQWSDKKSEPIQNSAENKNLKIELDDLKVFIQKEYNAAIKHQDVDAQWLENTIDKYNGKIVDVDYNDLLKSTKYIIDNPDKIVVKKKGVKTLGISKNRKKAYNTFYNLVQAYIEEKLNGKTILIKNIDKNFADGFRDWMLNKEHEGGGTYSLGYVGKNIDELKAVCNYAAKNLRAERSEHLDKIDSFTEIRKAEDIIILTPEEQETIKKADLKRDALKNARKWLLFGCLVGQRGSDLLSFKNEDIKEYKGMKVLELQQEKTDEIVVIPLFPEALEIISDGFPYKISLSKFNEYIKEICMLAKINEPTKGKIRIGSNGVKIPGIYPKYKLLGSHVCRRSFATNYYGVFPTPMLMKVTGHRKETNFLVYIGKTEIDNAYQMIEMYQKLNKKKT